MLFQALTKSQFSFSSLEHIQYLQVLNVDTIWNVLEPWKLKDQSSDFRVKLFVGVMNNWS